MDARSQEQTFRYHSFILRLWREGRQGAWRASIQNSTSGEKVLFSNLERLCLYLLMLDESV